ncbi:HAMP domain-containing sensor histidine kinase [Larkinella soli]|uniref:HAMP domain-containing sensor histidine kinase n=1 Tax=Larkinella soli TaxID=1770527 RepID=UPI000FFBCD71|nr:HAMP domain-containing sensor histidine kinase [Larkinella soli]
MTIRTRLTLRFTGLVSAFLALTFISLYGFCRYFITSDFYSRLDRKAHTYAEMLIRYQLEPNMVRQLNKLRKDQLPNQKITIYDRNDYPFFTTNDAVVLGIPASRLNRIRQEKLLHFQWNQFYVTGLQYTSGRDTYLLLASARNPEGDQFLRTLLQVCGGLFGIVVGLMALSGWLYAGEALEPMQRIEKQLSRIFPRNRQERLPVGEENDEINRLSTTINRLLDRVEESFQLQQMFVSNVSHELKNPLTQISSQLEVSLLKQRDEQSYQQTIRSVLEDVDDLSKLTHSLLQLSRVSQTDSGELLSECVRVDEVVWDVLDEVGVTFPQCSVRINAENLPDDFEQLSVPGNALLLRIALKNLIENACKFSSDRQVRVGLDLGTESVQVRIENEGAPIPAEDLPYIFEPFFRSQKTAGLPGYGIGLMLVERIIRLHHGRISVASSEGQPTVFELELFRKPGL